MQTPATPVATSIARFMVAIGLLVGASTAQAQVDLRGRVTDEAGHAVAGAAVTLSGVGFTVRTDSNGVFRLSGNPGGTIGFTIRAEGYREVVQSVTLPRRGVHEVTYQLESEDAPEPEFNRSGRLLSGRVLDHEGQGIAYATLQVNGGRGAVSDDSGRFSVPVNTATGLTLLFRRIGYEPIELKLAGMPDTALRVQMTPLPTALPEMLVTGRSPYVRLDLGGFYRRRADVERGINRGYFITPEELEARRPVQVTTAVEHLPNIKIRPIPGASIPLNRLLRIEDSRRCPLTVYLDGVRVSPMMVRGNAVDEEINSLVSVTSLSGIEVYPRAAGAPPQFSLATGTCGLVLLWTK